MNKLIKDYFKGWNVFEYILLGIGLVLPLTLGLIFGSSPLEIIAATFAVCVAISFAKGKIEGYFLLFISLALYAYIMWTYKLYGEFIIQITINLPIAIAGVCAWAKNRRRDKTDGQVVVVGHVKKTELAILLVSQAAMGVGYYFLLRCFGTQQLLASTFSLVFAIIGGYLLMRRSRKNMYFSVASDLSSVCIWIMIIISGHTAGIVMLVAEIMFVIIDIHGIHEWTNLKKRQRKPRTKPIITDDDDDDDL